MSRRAYHRNTFKPAPLSRAKAPGRSGTRGAAQLAAALKDDNTKLWLKRYLHCSLLSEKIRLDLFRESLITGEGNIRTQYMATIEGEYAASKDPRYPYIQPGASKAERDEFWLKFDELPPRYPETTYDKCMQIAVYTFGVQVLRSLELQNYTHSIRNQLARESARKAMRVLRSQGWLPKEDKWSPQSYPSSPYHYLRNWVGKSFQFSDGTGTETFVVASVCTSTASPVYIIKGPSGNAREVSERDFHAMVFDLEIP